MEFQDPDCCNLKILLPFPLGFFHTHFQETSFSSLAMGVPVINRLLQSIQDTVCCIPEQFTYIFLIRQKGHSHFLHIWQLLQKTQGQHLIYCNIFFISYHLQNYRSSTDAFKSLKVENLMPCKIKGDWGWGKTEL